MTYVVFFRIYGPPCIVWMWFWRPNISSYRYICQIWRKHQSSAFMIGQFFFKKNCTDLKPKAWVSPKKVYGSFLGPLPMVSTRFLRVCRRWQREIAMFFFKLKKLRVIFYFKTQGKFVFTLACLYSFWELSTHADCTCNIQYSNVGFGAHLVKP